MTTLKAYRIFNEDGKVAGRYVDMRLDELDAGDVVIKVAYSSINFKDALAATGTGKIIRRFPCVGGIDLSGTVVESSDGRFRSGEAVLATSYDIGVAHDGGYAEYARIPGDWVVPVPHGLSLFEAMALGTAGFTAALAVERMEHDGLKPTSGPVIVTGATGGVGSIAIDILAGAGYDVVALTGKEKQTAYLQSLGAKEVLLRAAVDLSKIKPLDKARWAGAIDNLGGDVLAWIASSMQIDGTIASIGLAASPGFNATVMPFILRGVSLLGIDSVNAALPVRKKIWKRLGSDLKPGHLHKLATKVNFADLDSVFSKILKQEIRGRTVVTIAG
ncbi:MAG: oxidoreductase [Burkholderiales bacterium]